MKRDDIQQLLGGYATGTLSPEEQQMLFAAALEDQELFDLLMREQALKDALDDPSVRRELIAELAPKASDWKRFSAWIRWQYPVAGVGALAAAALMVVLLVRQTPRAAQMASVQAPPVAAEAESPAVSAPKATMEQPQKPKPAPIQEKKESRAVMDSAQSLVPNTPAAGGVGGGVIGGVIGGVPMAVSPPPPPPPQQQAEARPAPVVTPPAALPKAGAQLGSAYVASAPLQPTKARDLFYAPAEPQPVMADAAPGRSRAFRPEAVAANQSAKTIPPAAGLKPLGLRYAVQNAPTLLTVESNSDATLYLFRRAGADWLPVTPGGMSLKARTPATTPVIAAETSLLAVLSRVPLPILAQTGAALTTTLDQMRAESAPAPPLSDASGGSTFAVSTGSRPMLVPINIP